MRFALVVPALNEEEAIGGTLRRCLETRAKVTAQTPVTEMRVVFVNDGSTDRTQEIVDQAEFKDVVKVRFEKNRGYGAAIKAGFAATDADVVGFIDADGTCEPEFCVKLINRMVEAKADVVLAARLTPESQMPLVRKIGNVIFARLLGLVSGQHLTDTASGFRVMKRSSLSLISPLPDGLHFTPAMSCICLLDPRLRIEEVPMPYKERIGRSKLSVIKDGFRFLYTILFSACCYAPLKTMLGASAIVTVLTAMLAWGIYLLHGSQTAATVTGLACLTVVMILVSAGVIVHQLNFLLIGPRQDMGPAENLLQYLLNYKRLLVIGAAAGGVGLAGMLVWATMGPMSGWRDLILSMGWMVMIVGGVLAMVIAVVVRVIWAVGEKQKALMGDGLGVKSSAGSAGATQARGAGAAAGGGVAATSMR